MTETKRKVRPQNGRDHAVDLLRGFGIIVMIHDLGIEKRTAEPEEYGQPLPDDPDCDFVYGGT